jgi:hypothetical protein
MELAPPDSAFLERLEKIWVGSSKDELKACWEIGAALNRMMPAPYERMRRGGRAYMQAASKVTGLSIAETERLRWFVYNRYDLQAIRSEFPKIKTWEQMKRSFPSNNPVKGSIHPALNEEGQAALREAKKVLNTCASIVARLEDEPTDADVQAFRQHAEEFSRAAGKVLKACRVGGKQVKFPKLR